MPVNQPKSKTAEAAHGSAVALVVRHAELLPEAVQTAMQFRGAAQAVCLYLLEPAATALEAEENLSLKVLKTVAAVCGCNHRPTVERLGLAYADLADMAKELDAAAWVLTF